MNDLFGEKITEMFDYLFWNDKEPVILLENGKGIKLNRMAKEFFSHNTVEEIITQMDKSSSKTWRNFLKEATFSNNAKCQICLTDNVKGNRFIELQGNYYQSSSQYLIRFKQRPHEILSHNIVDGLMKYEFLFKYAPHGLILTDTEGTIIDFNQKATILFDVAPHELKGKKAHNIFDLLPHSKSDFEQFFKTLSLKGSAEMSVSKLDTIGEPKFYHFTSAFNNNLDMYVTVIRDDTENVQLKKQIEHSRSLSTLGQMAASIAHEIRNPLTSLKGFTQLLTSQVTEQGYEYLDIINSELIRMESILNEFLVLSKPPSQSFQFISVSSIISQVVDFMHPQGIIQNIELVMVPCENDSDWILGDAHELKKVFMNVLKNSMEVMPNGGKVFITQSLRDNNQVCVSVKDQGGGMTQEQMQKIFLPFYTSKEQGTGLGLAHAIQTIEDHGGSIEVESELTHGTTFHIILPVYHLEAKGGHTVHDKSFGKSNREVISSN
ncbi:ATP-binding protein [Paenisporosarcina sp. FSL H8-0542]|uniref:ATP-binding protein n=1 Tax=Paenisporosarcina sp. FSL H8-0542 TaxID=2921401 RepID=UPI00315B34DB